MARQAATLGSALTPDDIGRLRDELASGKRPRIQLRQPSPVGPAGTSGAVVLLQEPAKGEFIVVAVSGDELPFAPEELTWPVRRPRGSAAAKAAPKQAAAKTPAGPSAEGATPQARPIAAAASAAPAAEATVAEVRPAPLAASPPPPPPAPATIPAPATMAPPAKPAGPARAESKAAVEPANPPVARRPRAGSKVPAFSVTLRFNGTTWSMESHRGGKRSKATAANLAAVRAFAERIDDVELRNQMRASLELCRREVAARASALREELEQAEIFLAELEDDV